MTAGAYEVTEIERIEDFRPLEAEWNRLLVASPSDVPFLRHEWLRLWWEHFGAGRRPAILTARREGALRAALALLEEPGRFLGLPFITLRSMTNFHSFRFNVLAERGEEAAVASLWGYLRRRKRPWHVVLAEETPGDVPALRPLVEAARASGAPVGSWHAFESPYLSLDGGWEEYLAGLSKNMRTHLRKRGRALAERGAVTYDVVRGPVGVREALAEGLAIEGSGWKDEAGSAIQADANLAAFYHDWAEVAARHGWLRLGFLRVDGRAVAFDYSLAYGERYFALKIGYDPAWHAYSVGQLLKAEILKSCFASPIREYDFLGSLSRAKQDWKPKTRSHEWIYVYNSGPSSRAHHLLKFTLRERAKRLMRR